jgi:hypothetical protein
MNEPTAAEINKRFWRKMRRGGRIDKILNGEPVSDVVPYQSWSDEYLEVVKRSIDVQLVEYEAAIAAAKAWSIARRPKGFRKTMRHPAA